MFKSFPCVPCIIDFSYIGMLPSRIAQLSPPQTNILNAFEKPIPNRSSSPNLPLKRPASGSRPKSSRRPPSRTSRDRLSVIQQDSRYLMASFLLHYTITSTVRHK